MDALRSQASLARFLAPEAAPGRRLLLPSEEAHHLRHVLRLRPGQEILLLDTQGKEYWAEVERFERDQVWVKTKGLRREEPRPLKELILGLPLLKRDLLPFLVEKAVELGLSRVILVKTSRTPPKKEQKLRSKLERRALQALKQCRRLWRLNIEGPVPLEGLADLSVHKKIVAYEYEKARFSPSLFKIEPHQRLLLLSGPEGGFSLKEISFLQAKGFESVSLGRYILRAETAAFYLMCVAHSQNLMDLAN